MVQKSCTAWDENLDIWSKYWEHTCSPWSLGQLKYLCALSKHGLQGSERRNFEQFPMFNEWTTWICGFLHRKQGACKWWKKMWKITGKFLTWDPPIWPHGFSYVWSVARAKEKNRPFTVPYGCFMKAFMKISSSPIKKAISTIYSCQGLNVFVEKISPLKLRLTGDESHSL